MSHKSTVINNKTFEEENFHIFVDFALLELLPQEGGCNLQPPIHYRSEPNKSQVVIYIANSYSVKTPVEVEHLPKYTMVLFSCSLCVAMLLIVGGPSKTGDNHITT